MAKRRTDAEQQVADLLHTARKSLHMPVAFLTRMDGTTQHLQVVDTRVPVLVQEGAKVAQETSFCQKIIDGELPAVMDDVKKYPLAMSLPSARIPRIRSYVSTPVTLSDGSLYGTFCAFGFTSDKELNQRDEALMKVLASAASVVIEPELREQQRRDDIDGRLGPLVASGGPTVVLQPIVDLATGNRVGAEALSRFPADWGKAPDVVFAEAHGIGRGHEVELLALERAAEHLEAVDGYVAMNVSPQTLLTPEFSRLLHTLPLPRILLELSEHDQVEDYDALGSALLPFRAAGMRLAIDDVGAGFSSLRHIVVTGPDVIKMDRSIVSGLNTDPVLTKLVESLVTFGHGCGVTVVAEGIETAEEAAALLDLGVDLGQGWYFGRPGPPGSLLPVPSAVPRSLPVPDPGLLPA